MENMNKVFNLPVNKLTIINHTPEQCNLAAHAINNVDILYKALQELFNDYKALADSGDAGNWKLEETSVGMEAIAALKTYRGEK